MQDTSFDTLGRAINERRQAASGRDDLAGVQQLDGAMLRLHRGLRDMYVNRYFPRSAADRHATDLREDAEQEAAAAMLAASRRWQPDLGPFPALATRWMQGALGGLLHRERFPQLSTRAFESRPKILAADTPREHGRRERHGELAARLGVPTSYVQQVREFRRHATLPWEFEPAVRRDGEAVGDDDPGEHASRWPRSLRQQPADAQMRLRLPFDEVATQLSDEDVALVASQAGLVTGEPESARALIERLPTSRGIVQNAIPRAQKRLIAEVRRWAAVNELGWEEFASDAELVVVDWDALAQRCQRGEQQLTRRYLDAIVARGTAELPPHLSADGRLTEPVATRVLALADEGWADPQVAMRTPLATELVTVILNQLNAAASPWVSTHVRPAQATQRRDNLVALTADEHRQRVLSSVVERWNVELEVLQQHA